jgi:hypothetical protein
MREDRAMRPPVEMNNTGMSPRVAALREGAVGAQGEFHEWYRLWAESLARTEGEPLATRRVGSSCR